MSNESRPRRAWHWLAAALCIGLAVAPAPLAAQSAAGQSEADQIRAGIETQKFEDWTLRCQPASKTRPRACRMLQEAVSQDGGKPVLQFMVGRFGPEKILGAVIIVPLDVRLPPGLGIQVDQRPRHTYPFERCDPRSCQARAILDGGLLEDLKAGLRGQVRFQNATGQAVAVPISLKGFTAALRALP
jgi:invasion protein IalB